MANAFAKCPLGLSVYVIGGHEERSWGFYEVLDIEFDGQQEICKKIIGIDARQALSLQRHYHRREVWHVVEGTITVILDGKIFNLTVGQELEIPVGAVHSMINLGREPVLLYEKQIGVCREDDNDRLYDYAGRPANLVDTKDKVALRSVHIYKSVIRLLK